MTKEKLVENYIQSLKSHDWYYGYSDDMRDWRRGRESQAIMNAAHDALAEVDKELADKLYSEHRPKDASY